MKGMRILLILFGFLCPTLAEFTFRTKRTGGGDFTKLNSIINALFLPLDLNIEPKRISQLGGLVSLTATIGDAGFCEDLKINPGGDVLVSGEFLDGTFTVPGIEGPLKAYEISINANNLQFDCTIPLKVEVNRPLGFVNTNNGFGDLSFRSEDSTLTQRIIAYSPDFTTTAPVFAEPGACDADPGTLTYRGEDIGEVLGISITGAVIDTLEGDPNLVFNDVGNELCGLGNDIALEISTLITDNFLIDQTSSFFIDDPFSENEEGVIPALKSEEALRANVSAETRETLFDLTDREDFYVNFIIPEDPTEESIVTTVLGFLTEPNGLFDLDPLILFLNDQFPQLNIQPNGTIFDLDVLSIASGSFFDENAEEVDFIFDIPIAIEGFEAITADITLEANFVLIDIFPPVTEEGGEPFRILKAFQALGPQTLLQENIDLNDIKIKTSLKAKISIQNDGIPDNLFLENPFTLELEESFTVDLEWVGFVATLGILFGLDGQRLFDTPNGGLLNDLFDCVMALFPLTPRVTGGVVSQEAVNVEISQFFDAILVAVADVVENIIPIYQSVIPTALELGVANFLTDTEIFAPTECPETDPALDDLINHPYNFSEGFLREVADTLTAEFTNDILQDFSFDDTNFFIFGEDNIEFEDGTGFSVAVPVADGFAQTVSFRVQSLSFEGVLPPFFNELVLLEVIEDSEFFPQELRNVLDLGNAERPVTVRLFIKFEVEGVAPFPEDDSFTGPLPPPAFATDIDTIDLRLIFDRFDFEVDVLFRYTQFDVDDMFLGGLLNLGCYAGALNFPGGITRFDFVVENLSVTADCDCDNEMVQSIAEALENEASWGELEAFLGDALNRGGILTEKLFELARYETTLTAAQNICKENDYSFLFDFESFEQEDYAAHIEDMVPYIGVFAFVVLIPAVVACVISRHGPELKDIKNKKLNIQVNKDLLGKLKEEESDEKTLQHLHLTSPLFKNPLVPLHMKIIIPVLIILDVFLLFVGHEGDAMAVDVIGQVFLLPYNDQDFFFISVFSLVSSFIGNQSYFFGSTLFLVSIFWPYFRLLLLSLTWFLPPSLLSVHRRGKIIGWLDYLGRIGFIEFHFLLIVLVIFQVNVGTPDESYLPQQDFVEIDIIYKLLPAIFIFGLAVLVSIIIGNLMLIYQHDIENESRLRLRAKHLAKIDRKLSRGSLLKTAALNDKKKFSLAKWTFSVYKKEEDDSVSRQYTFALTARAIICLSVSVIVAILTLAVAGFVPTLRIEVYGFLSLLYGFAGNDLQFELSAYQLFLTANEEYGDDFIIYLIGLMFLGSITVIPLLQTLLMFVLMFKPMSVKDARFWANVHRILSVWSCVDVFVFSLGLTLTLAEPMAYVVANSFGFCDITGWLTEAVLEPMEYVGERDTDAGCLSLDAYVVGGAYVTIVAVFCLYLVNFLVSKLFFSFIIDRERVIEVKQHYSTDDVVGVKAYHKALQKLGLVKIEAFNKSKAIGTKKGPSTPVIQQSKGRWKPRAAPNPSVLKRKGSGDSLTTTYTRPPKSNVDILAEGEDKVDFRLADTGIDL